MKTLMTGVIAAIVGLGVVQGVSAKESPNMTIQNVRYTTQDRLAVRTPPVFAVGEVVYLRFGVDGMKREKGEVWGQEDLVVRSPSGNLVLMKNKVVDAKLKIDDEHLFSVTNDITLPQDSPIGKYAIHIVIRDMYAKDKIEFDDSFEVGKVKGKK